MSRPPVPAGRRTRRGLGPVAIPLAAALLALPLATVAREVRPAPHGDRLTLAPDAPPGSAFADRPEKLLAQGR
ncbi:hypothetical protein DY245_10675 [Streptomyces inhibens]|uniref:Uncharacterized protein n=1 Tax=Streptomyces inhibens TaxID=2293571 RepID=A0A371Q6P6_STRIH|nr:hypothetical protein [Streptomyces inhibens]REK90349.1 hypothetical protein DY245_10675 [Streptomyces inhibens]